MRCILVGLIGWFACVAFLPGAQADEGEPASRTVTPGDVSGMPSGTFWPTPGMVDAMCQRWALEAADRYELDTRQRQEVARLLHARWSNFLAEERDAIEPLLTEFIEARMAVEPPGPDQVADWAKRATPVFKRLKHNVGEGEAEVRTLLSDEQQLRFDAQRVRRRMGLQHVEGSLRRWSVGNVEPGEWWDRPQGYERLAQSQKAAEPLPPLDDWLSEDDAALADLPERMRVELSDWERYVIQFCDRYQFDRSQRVAADSMLREVTRRALDHLRRHRAEVLDVEARLADPGETTPEEMDRQLTRVYGPIDALFAELDRRLTRLTTRAQRIRVQQPARPKASPPAPD